MMRSFFRHGRAAGCAVALYACLAFFPAAPLSAQVVDEVNTFRLAQTYEQSGKMEQALRYYQDLLTLRPANVGYFDGVRRCLTQLKRYDDVIALLGDRLSRHPGEARLLVQRGGAWHRAGNAARARADWDAAVALEPTNSGIYMAVADEALDNRLYDVAVEVLLAGRTALRTPTLFTFEIARAYAMNMRFDQAMDEYLRYLAAEPAAQWQVQQHVAQFAELPQALESAIKAAWRAVNRSRDNIAVRSLLVWLLMERKDYAAAAEVTREIDRLKKANGLELLMFAQRAFSDEQFDVARSVYGALLEEYPDAGFRPDAAYHVARCAEAQAEQARNGGRALPEALDPKVRVPTMPEVAALYERVIASWREHPVGLEARYRLARLQHEYLGRSDAALDMLREVSAVRRGAQGRIDADVLIGDILLVRGDTTGAMTQYQTILSRGVTAERERDELRFRIAELHWFLGDFETAATELAPLTENSAADIANDALALSSIITQFSTPTDVPLKRYAAALLLERRRIPDAAAAAMRDIVSSFDAYPIAEHAALALGRIELEAGRPAAAIAAWEACLEKHPDGIVRDEVLFRLAGVLERTPATRARAITLYTRILEELPNSLFVGQARQRILELRKGSS